jgi:hypothetical protein
MRVLASPVFLTGAKSWGSGRRVKGLSAAKRRDVTAGSTLEAVAASWTMEAEEDGLRAAPTLFRMSWADLKLASPRRARAGRVPLAQSPATERASGTVGAALDLIKAGFGNAKLD